MMLAADLILGSTRPDRKPEREDYRIAPGGALALQLSG